MFHLLKYWGLRSETSSGHSSPRLDLVGVGVSHGGQLNNATEAFKNLGQSGHAHLPELLPRESTY